MSYPLNLSINFNLNEEEKTMSLKKENTVAYLKKEAKKLRKNNPAFKNHADSLNAKAKELGYENHQELLDNAFVLPKKDVERLKEREKLIKEINELFDEYINEYRALKSSGKPLPPFNQSKAFKLANKYRGEFADLESNPETRDLIYADLILKNDEVSKRMFSKRMNQR